MSFGRRSYVVRDEAGQTVESLNAKVVITIGGKVHTSVQLRTPGMIAVICHPDTPTEWTIEILETSKRYTDVRLPPEAGEPLPWQKLALASPKVL